MKDFSLRGFASDNNAGAHPAVVKAISDVNFGHVIGYGDDKYTEEAVELIKDLFGAELEVFFVFNGTAANVLNLKNLTDSFNSVICAETSHVNVDECGAPEKFTGCKLLTVPTDNGKLSKNGIQKHLHGFAFEHHSQPKVISITQATELGTVYTPAEIKELASLAREYDLYLHMDGARLCNAAVSLNTDFREITSEVDAISFGITKNGAINAEAVIFRNRNLTENFRYYRKQAMQLGSKMRFMSAQFLALLKDDLWKENARQANKMAQLLAGRIAEIPEIKITQKVESNGVFAIVPKKIIEPLQREFFFYIWDESRSEVRWMTSFDTTEEDIDRFISLIQKLLKQN
jgi:threonine aldolase